MGVIRLERVRSNDRHIAQRAGRKAKLIDVDIRICLIVALRSTKPTRCDGRPPRGGVCCETQPRRASSTAQPLEASRHHAARTDPFVKRKFVHEPADCTVERRVVEITVVAQRLEPVHDYEESEDLVDARSFAPHGQGGSVSVNGKRTPEKPGSPAPRHEP